MPPTLRATGLKTASLQGQIKLKTDQAKCLVPTKEKGAYEGQKWDKGGI